MPRVDLQFVIVIFSPNHTHLLFGGDSVSVSVGYWKWTHSLSINYPGWVSADVT